MPSNTGKTIKRAQTKTVARGATRNAPAAKKTTVEKSTAAASRSVSHKAATIDWLRQDAAHAASLLEAALESGDAGDFMAALRLITEARGGISRIAEMTGLNREALYRTLSKKGNPQLSSLLPILQATGLRIAVHVA